MKPAVRNYRFCKSNRKQVVNLWGHDKEVIWLWWKVSYFRVLEGKCQAGIFWKYDPEFAQKNYGEGIGSLKSAGNMLELNAIICKANCSTMDYSFYGCRLPIALCFWAASNPNLAKYFGVMAIFLVLPLGLFGLAAFHRPKAKKKEIGVSQGNGSSLWVFWTLVSKDLWNLIWFPIVIAMPFGLVTLRTLLESYAYQDQFKLVDFL